MKLVAAAVALAAFVPLLLVALPILGLLALCGRPSRDRPAVRPRRRRRAVPEGVLMLGDVLALGLPNDRVLLVRRTRRGERWWRMIGVN